MNWQVLSAIGFFPGVSDVMESNHLFIPCAYLNWILSSTEALVAPISNSPFLALTCEAPTLPHQLWSYSAHWPPWPSFHVPDGHSLLTCGRTASSAQSPQTPGCRKGSVSKDAGLTTHTVQGKKWLLQGVLCPLQMYTCAHTHTY